MANQRYELLEVLRESEGIRSSLVKDLTTGQVVEVHHFLNSQAPDSKAILSRVLKLPRGGSNALLEFGADPGSGTPYVLTLPLGIPFREWFTNEVLRSQGFTPPVPPVVVGPPPVPAVSPQMAQRDPFGSPFPPPPPAPNADRPPAQLIQDPAAEMPPGFAQQRPQAMGSSTVEFHRLFADSENVATLRSNAPLLPPNARPAGPGAGSPGEFTMMFGASRPNVAAAQPPPPPAQPPPPPAQPPPPPAQPPPPPAQPPPPPAQPPPPPAQPPPPPAQPPPPPAQPAAAPAIKPAVQARAPIAFELALNPPVARVAGQPPPLVAAPTAPATPPVVIPIQDMAITYVPSPAAASRMSQVAASPAAATSADDDFEKMFGSPGAGTTQEPHKAAADDDFGKMFGTVVSAPEAAPSHADDDFDRMFGAGAAVVKSASPEPVPEPTAEIPMAIADAPAVPVPPLASTPGNSIPGNPPGDFTQMFQAPKQEQVPVPAVVSAPPVVPVSVLVPATSWPANPPSPMPPPPPVIRPPGVPTPSSPLAGFPVDRSTIVAPPNLSAKTFDPPKPPLLSQTVEFNRLFEERSPVPPQVPPPAPPARPVSQSGGMTVEFNRLFEPDSSPAKTMQGPAATPTRAPQQGVPPVPPGTPAQQSPGTLTQNFNAMSQTPRPGAARPMSYMTAQQGEFTQMFQAPQRAPLPGRAPTPPALPPPPPGQANQPGEFTQMFQSPGMPPAGPTPAVGGATSDFSALFHNQGRSNADFTPHLAQPPIAPPPPRRGDDFEELFGGAKAQPQPLPASQPGFGGGGSVTSAFSTPPFPTPSGPASQPFSGGASPLSPAAGGGSYTQFIQRPGVQPALGLGQQPAVAKPPLPPPVRKRRIPNYVWVGGGVLLLLIVATITFFALRKH